MKTQELKGLPNPPPYLEQYVADIKPNPNHFSYNNKIVKAFILGTDPSNFSIEGKTTKVLSTVFGIGEGDARYFSGILANLKEVGLSLEDVYVQNLVRNYLNFETSQNHTIWLKFAELWLPLLKEEIDSVDNTRKNPVLVTAEVIFKFLYPAMSKFSVREIYRSVNPEPIYKMLAGNDNLLGRPVIPFYRHFHYKLSKIEFTSYKEFIRLMVNSIY